MQEEANTIIKILDLKKMNAPDKNLPMSAYSNQYNNLNVYLILNGTDPMNTVENIGSEAATLTTYIGINSFHPDLIMSVGTAGGVRNTSIGDVFIGNTIYFYDRRLHSQNYKRYGNGNYSSPNTKNMAKNLSIKIGVICSGGSFEDDQTDLAMLEKENCTVKDMEAAGVAWVSMLEKIPMIAIKGITDHIGHISNHEQFEKNFSMVNEKLSIKIREILDYLSNKKIS